MSLLDQPNSLQGGNGLLKDSYEPEKPSSKLERALKNRLKKLAESSIGLEITEEKEDGK